VEGRQTADLRQKCGTDSQGKTALAIVWKLVPFGKLYLAALNEGTFDLMIHRHLPSNQKKPDSPTTIAIEE